MKTANAWARIALLFWVGLATACSRSESPVARLSLGLIPKSLPFPGFFEVSLEFEPLRELPAGSGRPIVFLHLLDRDGQLVRTFDRPLDGHFQPGTRLEHRVRLFQSALAEPLEPGEYRLTGGLYDSILGRYELATPLRKEARGEYRLGLVMVPALTEFTPVLRVSEGWLASEIGSDQQVLVWRPLGGTESGSIQLDPLRGPGRLLIALEIPRPASGMHLELEPGAELPQVQVTGDCGAGSAEISGFGYHELELEVRAAPSGESCRLTFEPNFRLVPRERKPPSSIRLGIVAWASQDGPY